MILNKTQLFILCCAYFCTYLWPKGNVISAGRIILIYVLEQFILMPEFSSMFTYTADIKKLQYFLMADSVLHISMTGKCTLLGKFCLIHELINKSELQSLGCFVGFGGGFF